MTLYIPVWVVVLLVALCPFIVAAVVNRLISDSGYFGNGLHVAFFFLLSAAMCWTGLLVWWWTR